MSIYTVYTSIYVLTKSWTVEDFKSRSRHTQLIMCEAKESKAQVCQQVYKVECRYVKL